MHFPTIFLLFAALARAQDFPSTQLSNVSTTAVAPEPPLSTSDLSSSIESFAAETTAETTAETSVEPSVETSTETSTGFLPEQTEIDIDNSEHGALAPVELTPQESVDAVGFEIEMYAQLMQKPIGSTGSSEAEPETAPVVIPSCPNAEALQDLKRWLGSSSEFDKRGGRPKRPVVRKCTPNELVIDIKFHYVTNGIFFTFPPTIASRIQKQVDFMNQVLEFQGITLNYQADPETVYGPEFTEYGFYGADLTAAKKLRTRQNDAFMRDSRTGGPDVLNVWLVNSMTDLEDPAFFPAGHAYFPEWRKFKHDGVVMLLGALRTNDDALALSNPKRRGSTLLHEIGHWMGLTHTFGDSVCTRDDGITDTIQTSGASPGLYECEQTRCGRPNELPKRVQNWMSYSRCKGVKPNNGVDYRAFTPNQRAAMFARFLMFRRNEQYSSSFCPTARAKRQSGAEDEAKALTMADLLLQNCTVAIQDVYQEDTIPLQQVQLASISSEAVSLSANPKPANTDPAALLPQTVVLGSATTEAGDGAAAETGTATGDAAGAKKTGGVGRNMVGSTAVVVLVTVVILAI